MANVPTLLRGCNFPSHVFKYLNTWEIYTLYVIFYGTFETECWSLDPKEQKQNEIHYNGAFKSWKFMCRATRLDRIGNKCSKIWDGPNIAVLAWKMIENE